MSKAKDILADTYTLDKIARNVFRQVDTDDSGYISESELETLMKNIASQCDSPTPTRGDIQDAMRAIDTNNDGRVSFDEFKVLIIEILKNL